MATLSEKINKNKSILKTGQGLFETTGESLMSKIRERNLAPGAGTSPMAAAGLGVGPDAAKMAGTGTQVDRAIRESIAPEKKAREPQARMFLTEEEQREKQRAQQLSNLDRLGARIGTIVNQAVASAQVRPVYKIDLQENVISADYPDLTTENRTSFESILAETTFDENGNPVITDDMLGRINALLPEDKKIASIANLKKYVTGATVGQLKLNSTKVKEIYPGVTEEQMAAIEGLVSKAGLTEGGKPEDMSAEDLNKVAELLGITDATRDEVIGKIKELITPVSDTVIDNITSTLGPAVALSSLTTEDWQAFGLGSAQDLGNLIGLESDEIQDMTIGDLQKKIDALMMADYDRVEELTRVANDPFYPEALRKAAKAELRDLSSVGVIATEADFNKLNEAVQAADEIEIGDKTYTTEELLSDEQLTVLIASYLEDPESDYSKDLLDDFPALVEFINGNKAALENAIKYLDESIKNKIDISKKNDELNKYSPEEGVDIDLTGVNQAVLGEDFEAGVFSDVQMSEGEFTVGEGEDAVTYYHQANLREENVFNKEDKRAYADILSKTANKPEYRALFNELATKSADEIWKLANTLNIDVADYINRRYAQVTNQNTLDTAIANVASNPNAPQQALENIFGGKAKLEELAKLAKQGNLFRDGAYGTLSKDAQELVNNFVFNNDGTFNYLATANKLKTLNSSNDVLKEAGITAVMNKTDIISKNYSVIWNLVKDGELSVEDVNSILDSNDPDMIDKMASITFTQYLAKGEGVGKLPTIVKNYYNTKASEVFSGSEAETALKELAGGAGTGISSIQRAAVNINMKWRPFVKTGLSGYSDTIKIDELIKNRGTIRKTIASLQTIKDNQMPGVQAAINAQIKHLNNTLDILNKIKIKTGFEPEKAPSIQQRKEMRTE